MPRSSSGQVVTTYELHLLSRVEPGVPTFETHKKRVKEWAAMEGAWKLSGEPSMPGTGVDSFVAVCKLAKHLPPKVKGYITYYTYLPQDGSGRDWSHSITLEFKPHQVAYRELLEVALPGLIRIFHAHRAYIVEMRPTTEETTLSARRRALSPLEAISERCIQSGLRMKNIARAGLALAAMKWRSGCCLPD